MKRIGISIALGLFAAFHVFAQKTYKTNYEVQYKIVSHLDSLHRKDERNELGFLYTGAKQSVYMSYLIAQEAGFLKAEQRKKLGLDAGSYKLTGGINPSLNKRLYKNLNSNETFTVAEILKGKTYCYDEPTPLNWAMEDSTKNVQGYTAKKAVTHFAGRDYVAWFTVEVPIPDGPYVFSGLPGLIVELYDQKKDYHFVLNSVQKLKISKDFQLPDVAVIEKEKFNKLHQIAQKNWAYNMMAERYSGRSNLSEKEKEKKNKNRSEAEQLIKNQNNPIELK